MIPAERQALTGRSDSATAATPAAARTARPRRSTHSVAGGPAAPGRDAGAAASRARAGSRPMSRRAALGTAGSSLPDPTEAAAVTVARGDNAVIPTGNLTCDFK